MVLWCFKAIKLRHARLAFEWRIVMIEGMMNNVTRLCAIFMMARSCRFRSNLSTPNKRSGSAGMKIEILSVFLVALAMVKLIDQLECNRAKKGKEEVCAVLNLNHSMASIPTTFFPFTMLEISMKRIGSQRALILCVFSVALHNSIAALVLR